MKVVDLKNHVGGQSLYRSLDPSKKRRHFGVNKNTYFLRPTLSIAHSPTNENRKLTDAVKAANQIAAARSVTSPDI